MGRLVLAAAGALTVLSALTVGTTEAGAHVTVSPAQMARGTSDAILSFRVPNESPTAAVDGLRIAFPLDHPIVSLSPEAGSGWQVSVHTTALAKPVKTDDGTFTSVVSEIDWSGGSIPVGQFGEFNVLAQGIPSATSTLVFKAIETYSDGTVVSWIELPSRTVPNPAHPAPTIALTSGGTAGGSASGGTPSTSAPAVATGSTGNDWQFVVALILAGFAVVLALLAVWLGRPRPREREERGDPGSEEERAQPDPVTSRGAAR